MFWLRLLLSHLWLGPSFFHLSAPSSSGAPPFQGVALPGPLASGFQPWLQLEPLNSWRWSRAPPSHGGTRPLGVSPHSSLSSSHPVRCAVRACRGAGALIIACVFVVHCSHVCAGWVGEKKERVREQRGNADKHTEHVCPGQCGARGWT